MEVRKDINSSYQMEIRKPTRREFFMVLFLQGASVLILGAFCVTVSGIVSGFASKWTSQMLYALILTVIASIFGSASLALTWKYWTAFVVQGVFAGMSIRLMTSIAGIVIVVVSPINISWEFLVFMAGFYTVGLVIETLTALKLVNIGSK